MTVHSERLMLSACTFGSYGGFLSRIVLVITRTQELPRICHLYPQLVSITRSWIRSSGICSSDGLYNLGMYVR